jgi:hypothetical protein
MRFLGSQVFAVVLAGHALEFLHLGHEASDGLVSLGKEGGVQSLLLAPCSRSVLDILQTQKILPLMVFLD